MTEVKNMFSPSERVKSPKGKRKAQQQFKADADINTIMKKFQKTNAMDHVTFHQGSYGYATPMDLHEAMNIVTKAETMFQELPSSLREKFATPGNFLEYVQDPANGAEARELGLSLADKAQAEFERLEAAQQAAAAEPDPVEAPPVESPEKV